MNIKRDLNDSSPRNSGSFSPEALSWGLRCSCERKAKLALSSGWAGSDFESQLFFFADRSRQTALPVLAASSACQLRRFTPAHLTHSPQLPLQMAGALQVSSPGAENAASHKMAFRSLGQTNLMGSGKQIKLINLICSVKPRSHTP